MDASTSTNTLLSECVVYVYVVGPHATLECVLWKASCMVYTWTNSVVTEGGKGLTLLTAMRFVCRERMEFLE